MLAAILAAILIGTPQPAPHDPDTMPLVQEIKFRIASHEEVEPAPPPAMSVNWDVLAECESHGEWDYNENSGWGSGIYDGGLQFDPNTWLGFGGGEFATTADQATREQQIVIAERVLDVQGLVAWPACTRALGWR